MESVDIHSKENGIILTMVTDSLINENDLSAWQANSGWFYITLYKIKGYKNNLNKESLPSEIFDFQIIQGDESLQLGLRLRRPIENHEFTLIQGGNTILASLYYSREYFSQLDSIEKPNKSEQINGLPNGIKKF